MEERKRFTEKSPLATLFTMSVGPLLDNIFMNLNSAVEMALISNKYGGDSVQIFGFSSLIRWLSLMCGSYFGQCIIAKVSRLYGEKNFEEANRVAIDIYRIAFFSAALFSLISYFLSPFLLQFMGCSAQNTRQSMSYLAPLFWCLPFITTFQLSTAYLNGRGLSIIAGLMQLVAFILNCGVLQPTLLYLIKIPFSLSGLSFCLSQIIVGLVLTFIINKPKAFLVKFTKETIHALKLALPFLVNVVTTTIPPIILLRKMMEAATNKDDVAQVYSVFQRIQSLINSVNYGIGQGFVGCGSFANSASMYQRFTQLFLWALLVTVVYQLIWIPFMCVKTRSFASIWLEKESELSLADKMLPIPFYSNFLSAMNTVSTNFLSAVNLPFRGILSPFLSGIAGIIATYSFYYAYPNDAVTMMHVYNVNDVAFVLFNLLLLLGPLRKLNGDVRTEKSCINIRPLVENGQEELLEP